MPEIPLGLLLVGALALLHILGDRLHVDREGPRLWWLSAAGGASVSFVFLLLLPELARHQQALDRDPDAPLALAGRHVWVAALLGVALFAALERVVVSRARDARQAEPAVFAVHLMGYALFNLAAAWLLTRQEDGALPLLVFGGALALHLAVNDFALREHHGRLYHRVGRWVLATSLGAGWVAGTTLPIPQVGFALLYAFVSGALLVNVLKEELPPEREGRLAAFLLGLGAFGGVLLVAL